MPYWNMFSPEVSKERTTVRNYGLHNVENRVPHQDSYKSQALRELAKRLECQQQLLELTRRFEISDDTVESLETQLSFKPIVGVGVLVVRDGKIPLGTRKGSHSAGCKALVGGKVDFGESFADAGVREVREETGMVVKIRPLNPVSHVWFCRNHVLEGRHCIGHFLVADWVSGELKTLEPDKCEGWDWVTFDELLTHCRPDDHFLPLSPLEYYREQILKG